jgi:PTS system mannose-specific IID component
MYLRLFAVQGSWNYETMIGAGLAFVLLPVLRHVHGREGGDEAALRHARFFNAHPYLCGVAAGALARMESEGVAPEVQDRFKNALRGALGALGDQLVWGGWRPLCVLIALSAALLGAPWWLVLAGFLGLYNAGHLTLRAWGLAVGLQEGPGVARRLRDPWLKRAQVRMAAAATFLAGLVAPLAALTYGPGREVPALLPAAVLAALGGAALGVRLRAAAGLTLGLVVLVILLTGGGR